MGAHLTNPLSQAKANGDPIVRVVDLGDGYAFSHFEIHPAKDGEGRFAAMLVAVGGKASSLVGLRPAAVILGPLQQIAIADLKKAFAAQLGETFDTAEAETPKLEVVPA